MAPIIIFGPTGNVGSVVARTCLDHKAETVLAMRDPTKPIPGLTKADESTAKCVRVQADLNDQDSVTRAITSTGAKRAFIYLVHGSPDNMRTALEAMKDSGITFVVFLSTFTISPHVALPDIQASEHIPYVHAQVEINLDQVFGQDNYVAIRPGGFITNIFRFKDGIAKGKVRIFAGYVELDQITPGDMGRVSGAVLVSGPRDGQKKIYVYGPQLLSVDDTVLGVAKVLNRPIEIESMSADEGVEEMLTAGWPRHVAESSVRRRSTWTTDIPLEDRLPCYTEGVNNVKLYTGRDSQGFMQWIEDNKHMFVI